MVTDAALITSSNLMMAGAMGEKEGVNDGVFEGEEDAPCVTDAVCDCEVDDESD